MRKLGRGGRETVREGLGRRRVLPDCWGAAMERKEKRCVWAKRWQPRRDTICLAAEATFWRLAAGGFRLAEGVFGLRKAHLGHWVWALGFFYLRLG